MDCSVAFATVPDSMQAAPPTDTMAVSPLLTAPGLAKESSTYTPCRPPDRVVGVSYTRVTVPLTVPALPGKLITAALPAAKAAASSAAKGTVRVRLPLSTRAAMAVPVFT